MRCAGAPVHLHVAPNPEWSHAFAPGPEILAYFESVAARYGVDALIRYGNEVRCLQYSPDQRGTCWRIETSTGEYDEADVVIAAAGVLHHPCYPDIDGLDNSAGSVFHSARWDHSISLAGVRLGVIGTGSSAVQITGALAGVVGELHLFQRTGQWILPVDNPPTRDADRARYRADPALLTKLRAELNMGFVQSLANAVVDADSPAHPALADYELL